MRVVDHGTQGASAYGWTFRRYRDGDIFPVMVVDDVRGIVKPRSSGAFLKGAVDIHFDGADYVGLSCPFVLADIPATLIRAFPSAASVAADYLLQPGGGRNPLPADDFVPGDNDLWSVAHV